LVLAASGGPDSTALMLLMARWRDRPPVLVAIVDHSLRPEAAAEAKMAAENAERLGLPWRILKAPESYAGGNLQDWARRVRYRCLIAAAHEAGYDAIVTAHHLDDQAETFLLRLARGSGVYGLAAMPEESVADGVALVRPLINVARAALLEIARESGLPVVSDPSNLDPRFDRVRLRSLMPELAAHGLTPERLAETAERLGRAAAALDHYTTSLLRERFEVDAFGIIGGLCEAFAEAPEEVGLRALALILKAVGGADYTPRLEGVEAVYQAIREAGPSTDLKRTLHGVVIGVKRGRLTARREWGRRGLAAVAAPPGATLVWDSRFRVEVPRLSGELGVGPLGRSNRRLRSPNADRGTLRALPGLYQDGTLVAVPERIFAADRGAPLDSLAVKCVVGQGLGLGAAPKPSAARSPF
jgi:tRNA(Ile)-lysidine synthase